MKRRFLIVLFVSMMLINSNQIISENNAISDGQTGICIPDNSRIVSPITDLNGDKISDFLQEKLSRLLNTNDLSGSPMVDVIVSLNHPPNETDVQVIEDYGGRVFQQWSHVVYSVHAKLPLKNLYDYAKTDSVVLIEENSKVSACLDFSVKQTIVRPAVWNTYGYLNDAGSCLLDDSINAMNWLSANAQDGNIMIASISYGSTPSDVEYTALNNLVSSGVVYVVDAGNDSSVNYVGRPGTATKASTVGAVNDDALTEYSSIGDPIRTPLKPDVLAPGGIRRTGDENYLFNHSVMNINHDDLEKWIEHYNNAPKSTIDIDLEKENRPPFGDSSYSLLSHLEYTPNQRDQGDYCGNCWAWAGTGILGIALDVQEDIKDRLSVQFINSCGYDVVGVECCDGGWLSNLSDFYDVVGYTIPWSNTNAYWQDGDGSCDTFCGSISTNPRYPISSIGTVTIETQGISQQTAISNIKNVIDNNNAIAFSFFLPTGSDWQDFNIFWGDDSEEAIWNPDYSCGHTWDSGGGAHAVLCVGYHDVEGTDNDYWIMLNSWGTTSSRPNGLFRLDMDMDYSCYHYDPYPDAWYSFYWETLDVTFDIDFPTVITNAATLIEETSARLHGTLQTMVVWIQPVILSGIQTVENHMPIIIR